MHRSACIMKRATRTAAAVIAVLANSLVPVGAAQPVQVGYPGFIYNDPEFEPGGTRIVFQDGERRAWVGSLDPATGQCISSTCRDVLVATDLQDKNDKTRLFNGPEWGVNAAGSAIYFSKYSGGNLQSWRVLPDGTGLTQLTFARQGSWGGMVSVAPTAPTVRSLVNTGTIGPSLRARWFDEAVGTLNPLPGYWWSGQAARFLPGTARYAIYPWRNGSDYQLALIDTDLQSTQVVTADAGQKSQPFGLILQGTRHAVAVLDQVSLVIYRSGPAPWPQIAELTPAVPGWLISLEPLGQTGCFVVAVQNTPDQSYTDSAIYMACLSGSWSRLDNGAPSVRRSEPEPWRSPTGQWFVYWHEGNGQTSNSMWVVPVAP
jgi:hypothetical protein